MDVSRTVTLNNCGSIPVLGFGVWTGMDPELQRGSLEWVQTAIKARETHFDTALIYGTEKPLGEAIRKSGIPREEFFICTKFPWNHHARIVESLNESLESLGTDYVDLYLMHWPQYVVYEKGNFFPKNPDGTVRVTEERNFNQSWEVMEKLLETGKCKAIGVSNFSIKTLEKLFTTAKIIPAVNQIELHPYLVQEDLVQYCHGKGIVVAAYTPTGTDVVRKDPVMIELAEKYNATPTQVVLAWHLARGVVAVPKSADEGRQKENRKLPVLDPEDVQRISGLDRNARLSSKIAEVNRTRWGWTYEQLGWE
ncbi:related to GCY1-galactose-induced protein of aldo/keto reductase family [Armillaria ostoyae]|uniref:Related to GCY1-galactose-induced protein of aldo/keto reductase family n=1 Tax=Armillaria ostoyae TaxID=47428 RepID=A0A284RRA0_ARMOS|nr:related to GCY1-galactose-induced protein of aldo/keto reductase family [Armillaria ostoyae]